MPIYPFCIPPEIADIPTGPSDGLVHILVKVNGDVGVCVDATDELLMFCPVLLPGIWLNWAIQFYG